MAPGNDVVKVNYIGTRKRGSAVYIVLLKSIYNGSFHVTKFVAVYKPNHGFSGDWENRGSLQTEDEAKALAYF